MMKLATSFWVLIFLSFFSNAFSDTKVEKGEDSSRFIIHLLDYLAHDYGGAVVNGKVVSVSEYDEQKEFILKIQEQAEILPEIKNNSETIKKILKLRKLIDSKAEGVYVFLLAIDIQKDLIAVSQVALSPLNWPSLESGKRLYSQNCVSCHGQSGFGDGPESIRHDPRPTNFHNHKRMNEISAFHSYNTIRLGVPKTGMTAWTKFTDKEVWDLAFYVVSMRYQKEALSSEAKNFSDEVDAITLDEASSLSDKDLRKKINTKDEKEKSLILALLRTKDNTPSSGQYVGKAKILLNDSLVAFKKNSPTSKDEAKNLALRAYLEGIEPIESIIRLNDPNLVVKIEIEMGKIRKIIADPNGTQADLAAQIVSTQAIFTDVEEIIEEQKLGFGVAFSGAFSVILREGFEAVLIILTLLSVIKAYGNRRAALWIHAGWGSAMIVGFVTWFLSGFLMKMSGVSREILEATTSTIAVVSLLYFGFWLHRQTEISRWKKFIHEKVQGAIDNKNLLALATIAFISVFREAFETVFFIRALWFQTNNDGKNAMGFGVIAALALIFTFAIITLRYSKKIPVRELFKVSSILTSSLAFILAGKAVHSMQKSGFLNSTMIPWNIRFDSIGFFPTWQTVTAQILTLFLMMILINVNTAE